MENPKLFMLSASLVLLLLIIRPCPALCGERCNSEDKGVLLQIKKAFGDLFLDSWDPDTDCCTWYYIDCDPNTHRVNTLNIFASEISGQIPDSVGDLPFLETLIFRKIPDLSGPIPEAIAKLKLLKVVKLSRTKLSGPVPAFFGELKNLKSLDLSFNSLSGSIPGSLSLLPNLLDLRLNSNQLTGSIPDSFGTFAGSRQSLYLSHNQLSGKIPSSFNMFDASIVDISGNKLEGDLSMFFNPHKTTQVVDFAHNLLEFDFSGAKFPNSLQWLDLSHNKIAGRLPQTLTSLELQVLNVSYNQLCGPIPVGGDLQYFDYYSYFNNRCLCGAPLESCK